MEDRKILVEVTKEELELLQNGFKEPKNEEDEQPAHLIQRLLDKLDSLLPTYKSLNYNPIILEHEAKKLYEYSNFEITIIQSERHKPKIEIVFK